MYSAKLCLAWCSIPFSKWAPTLKEKEEAPPLAGELSAKPIEGAAGEASGCSKL